MEFRKYAEKNFVVFPVKIDKAPAIPKEVVSWKDIENSMDYKEYFKNDNIAIITGKKNKITVLDIDIEVDEIKNEFLKVLEDYPTPIMRRGNRNRIPSRFYAYNGEGNECLMMNFIVEGENKTKSSKVIEILGDGRYCVLPPTIRDDGTSFEWVGKDLLDMDLDHLPCINKDMIARFKVIINKYNVNPIKVTSGEIGEGRNSKLFELMSAKVGNGVSKEEAINEVIEYDLKHHDNPWTLDQNEPHGGNQKKVLKYLNEMFDRTLKKDLINHYGEVKVKDIEFNLSQNGEVFEEEESIREQLPHLRGIAQDMFQHLYSSCPTQKSHFAFATTTSLISVLIGNKVKLENTLPNIFSLVFSSSGEGKTEYMNFISEILMKADLTDLLGESSPSGETAIIMNLPDQRERIELIGEGSKFFKKLHSPQDHKSNMGEVYSDLYSSSGKLYLPKSSSSLVSDKNKSGKMGGCFSPYVSMLVMINSKVAKFLINEDLFSQGFLARFSPYLDSGRKMRSVYNPKEIPQEFIQFAKMWGDTKHAQTDKTLNLVDTHKNAMKPFTIPEAKLDADAAKMMKEMNVHFNERIFKSEENSPMHAILNRAYENMKKKALIDAASRMYDTTKLEITKNNLEWALKSTNVDIKNWDFFFKNIYLEGKRTNDLKMFLDYIKDKKEVSSTMLCGKFKDKLKSSERKELIEDLVQAGYISKAIINGTNLFKFIKYFNK